jgi:hypothetical protein
VKQRKVYVNGAQAGADTSTATLTAAGPIKIGYVAGVQSIAGNKYNNI